MNFIKNKRILGLLVVILASMAYLQNVMAETITPTIDISQKVSEVKGRLLLIWMIHSSKSLLSPSTKMLVRLSTSPIDSTSATGCRTEH